MKKAARGIGAANAFRGEIEEERKEPKQKGGGYNELLDEGSAERQVSLPDDENQLLKDEIIDETLF